MSNPDVGLAELIREVAREQTWSFVVAKIQLDLEDARSDARQAKARVDSLRRQLRKARAAAKKADGSLREWLGEVGKERGE